MLKLRDKFLILFFSFVFLCSFIPFNYVLADGWVDSVNPGVTDTDDLLIDSSLLRWVSFDLPSSNITKLHVFVDNITSDDILFNFAVYDSLGDLVVATSSFLDISDSGTFFEANIATTSISAGTYFLAWGALAGGADITFRNLNGEGVTYIDSGDSFFDQPYSILPSSDFTVSADASGLYLVDVIEPTPTSTIASGTPVILLNQPTFMDWLFGLSLIIAMLSLISYGFIFQLFRKSVIKS